MPEQRRPNEHEAERAEDPWFEPDGRKRKDVSRVGGLAPDTDPERSEPPRPRRTAGDHHREW